MPAGGRRSSRARRRTHRNCSKRSEKDCSTFSRVTFSYKSVMIQAERMVPVMDSIEVGARIAARRKGKGLTQKQLAESLHITDKAVSKWECGKNFPDLTVLEPLAAALDTTPADLLGLNENNSAELLSATAEIYLEQRRRWLKELRNRAWLNLVYCILVFAGLIWIGRYLNNKTAYEPPQILISGMNGLFASLTGSAIWTLRSTSKQLKNFSA